jgi:hypothetical protein
LVECELKSVWKGTVLAKFKVPSWYYFGWEAKENHETLRIVGVPAEIRAEHLPNTIQKFTD